jgi:uncharacterized protein YdeI (YjbR/CyaY-like superfamily)
MASADSPTLAFSSAADFERWLKEHYTDENGIWLKFAKKGSGVKSVTYPEAVEISLCYGWIDAQLKSLDERFYLQRFVPRRPKSVWSKRNIEKVEQLIASGRMQAPGLAQVEAAKADGRWKRAYDSPSTSQVPEDFSAAIQANRKAKAFFATLKRGNVYAMMYRLQMTKRPETRAKKIKEFVAMLARGEAIHVIAPKKK